MAVVVGGVPILDASNICDITNKIDVDQTEKNAESADTQPQIRRPKNNAVFHEDPVSSNPEESETRLCGWLNKCGNIGFVKTAKTLYFVFSDDTCKLYFYRTPQDLLPLGEIDIKHASFHFDASSQKPGMFEIRSDGKVFNLDAQGQHRMTYWLEELQKKRRLYNAQRKAISPEKMSWTLKNRHQGSGLAGSEPSQANDITSEISQAESGFEKIPSSRDLENMSPNSQTRYWSLHNLQSEIRDAVSSIRTHGKPENGSMSSRCREALDGWTVLQQDSIDLTHHPPPSPLSPPPPPSPPPLSPSASSSSMSSALSQSSGSKLGEKIGKAFSMLKAKPGQSNSSGKKVQQRSGSQKCNKCRALEGDLQSLREDLRATEEELEANRQIIKLLQKELDIMRVNMETKKECESKNQEELMLMMQQKDKHVVELEHSMIALQEEKSHLYQQAKFTSSETISLKDQITMLQDMLSAKDETIVKLTNQIYELENNNMEGQGDGTSAQIGAAAREALFMVDPKELETLKDSVRAYQLQNNFLTKEIMELNDLRKMDAKREKELLINLANLDAKYCQAQSRYLFLLSEKKEPVRGGDEQKSQEAVARLLQEALDNEHQQEDESEQRHTFHVSHNMVYDRYGFLMTSVEEQTDDVLVAKANQLQRQSDEISSRLKDVDETTSKHIKWENFMVGQSGKPLVRSAELKSLIRLGVPHEFKEHIWKGCINFYVALNRDKLGPTYYKKDLGERIKNSKSNPAAKQIELDLLRTLPTNRHFDSMDSDGIPKLRRVLLSYSVHNPLIGYCQGLNRLAAIALLFLSEEESFWCLEALVEHILPKDYFTKTLAGAQADQRVLKELVSDKLPKLAAHFEQHEVDLTLFTFNWYLTIFVDNVRPETFLHCWDAVLYEGSKVLFRFALAFLKYAEEEILCLKETNQIFRYMRMLGENITDIKKITHIAFYELNPFPLRTIQSKRAHHLQLVMEELRELDIIRQDFQSSHSPERREGYGSEEDLDDTLEEEYDEVHAVAKNINKEISVAVVCS